MQKIYKFKLKFVGKRVWWGPLERCRQHLYRRTSNTNLENPFLSVGIPPLCFSSLVYTVKIVINMPRERNDRMKMKKWTHFLHIADTTKALKTL